jgi:hypothetical protein
LAGDGSTGIFNTPYGVAALSNGNVAVADTVNHRIRLITPLGVVTTLAGDGSSAFQDGTGSGARFTLPTGVASLPNGDIGVADTHNYRIRLIAMPAAVVTTLAGGPAATFADGTGTSARFNTPFGIVALPNGNIIIGDYGNHRIRVVTPAGVATTLAGDGGTGIFNTPNGVAVLPNGNIVVADSGNNRIRLVTPEGVVTTLAGSGTAGSTDATGVAAQFSSPTGVAVLPNGNIVVADQNNHRIRLITMPTAVVTTLAGSTSGSANGTGTGATFNAPFGIAVFTNGNIVVADTNNNRVRLITPT